jgi:hypothetical protein
MNKDEALKFHQTMVSGGIFGPKLSGKTTLAKRLSSLYWHSFNQRTLCLDINMEPWGGWVMATDDDAKFWELVWNTKESLIIVDEGSTTINRDKELIPVFTRLRHLHHRLIVVGHSGTDLLPAMRRQLDTLYLFRQPKKAAEVWSYEFADERILTAAELSQFEFLACRIYSEPVRMKLKLAK